MLPLIAHRGASAEAPENTLPAFLKALQKKSVQCLECDVRLTSDGIPIIMHDATLQRTAGCPDFVHEISLDQIKKLDAGSWFNSAFRGTSIPTLLELLQLPFENRQLMIEIKKSPFSPKDVVAAVAQVIQQVEHPPSLLVGSFCQEIVSEVMKQIPQSLPIAIIEKESLIDPFLELQLTYYALWYPLINPSVVSQIKEIKSLLWAFTVDDPAIALFLEKIGLDGIITNDPERLKK